MGFFTRFMQKKEKSGMDFSSIKSNEAAKELCEQNVLAPLYIVPLRFGGEDICNNILYVPPEVVDLKNRYDAVVEKILQKEPSLRYVCTPEYKGKSFVPSVLHISVTGKTRFSQKIQIW